MFWPCYFGFGFLVWLGLPWLFHAMESGVPHAISLEDPYLLACLSGGRARVIRTALIALIDRGFLQVQADRKVARGPKFDSATSSCEVESRLLRFSGYPRDVDRLLADSEVNKAARPYQDSLRAAGLLLSFSQKCLRWLLVIIFTALLAWLGYKRFIVQANADNLEFGEGFYITTLCIIFGVFMRGFASRTGMGTKVLSDMRLQFNDLKSRRSDIPPGVDTDEVRRLVALFGLSALPESNFPFTPYLRSKSARGDS